MRKQPVFNGKGALQGPLVVSDIDWYEEVVHIYFPNILACHNDWVLFLWLLQLPH